MDALLHNQSVSGLFLPLQKPAAHKSCVHGGRREAYGAAAFHGLGESQAVSAPVQASRG